MKVSDRGLAEIISHEAIVTRRYKDSVGVWTVGIGHTKAAGGIDPVTVTADMPVADLLALFRKDIPKYEDGVNRAVKVAVTQYEFDALVSFHFNTGAIARASFVKALNRGERGAAAAGFMAWSKPPEIIGRRTKEMQLFRTGSYVAKPVAAVYPASNTGAVLWSKGKRVDVLPLLGATSAPVPVTPPPAGKAVIRLGDRGPLVAEWQRIIGVGDDGDFGPKTEAATKAWQRARGLVDDGVVGGKTWAALNPAP